MSVFTQADNVNTEKPREFAGFKLAVSYEGQSFATRINTRYSKAETEPLLDLEGQLEKVGPNGKPIRRQWLRAVYEGDVQISESDIRYLQVQEDGSKVEVEKLQRTNEVIISEKTQLDEVSMEGTRSTGVVIPLSDVAKYAPESLYQVWSDEAWAKKLAEYLEQNRLAILFPFTFGNGFKIYAAIIYPVRVDGKLYLLMVMTNGTIILTHPLEEAKEATTEKKQPVLAAPRLRKKQTL